MCIQVYRCSRVTRMMIKIIIHAGIGSNINVIFKLKYEDEYQTITQTLITYY